MATIYDIARAAGVHPSTVSYALSGKGTLSHQTRERVIECAQQLGYRPNYVARSLIKRETKTLGLIVPDISHPFYAEVAQAAERVAHDKGYRVFVASTLHDEQLGRELLDDLSARWVDGVIATPGGLSVGAIREARGAGLPLLCCFWEEAKVCMPMAVELDFEAGGRMAAEHLWSLGHRRLGLVTDLRDGSPPDHHLRVTGFKNAIEVKGQVLEQSLVRVGKSSVEMGRALALELLELAEPPTAIFATNDLLAMGVLTAAWARGVHVPTELSVVGFDDLVTAAYSVPPLTTVRVDKAEVVAMTLDSLLMPLAGEVRSRPILLAPTLVVRHSTTGVSTRVG